MKHLLKALDGRLSIQTSGADLNLLLNDIRESKDNKNSENFYETLDKVLVELRSTDHAAAFLKPVRKIEAPDYDLVIKHPMDLQTMQKKVKNHVYKNKQEFAADLNLIWDNCLTYNSDPNHHLRRSAMFMRKKADHILERITDKNERPGLVRLHKPPPAQHYSKSRLIESSDEDEGETPLANGRPSHLTNGVHVNGNGNRMVNGSGMVNGINGTSKPDEKKSTVLGKRLASRIDDVPFLERPAILRTPESMGQFRDLDLEMQRYLDSEGAGPSRQPPNAIVHHDAGQRIRKRIKTMLPEGPDAYRPYSELLGSSEDYPVQNGKKTTRFAKSGTHFEGESGSDRQLMGSWWQAVTNPTLQASGMPMLAQSSPQSSPKDMLKRKRPKSTRKAAKATEAAGLRGLMQKNIMTLRKMRKTHARLNAFQSGEEPRPPSPPPPDVGVKLKRRGMKGSIPLDGGQSVAKARMNVIDTMILEHVGFEGASKGALNVLSDVAADFMMNLGRTLRFYSDKYGQTMSAEEIILHVLFENGTLEVQELERYIKDDVERYGNKIADIERKLAQTYQDIAEPLRFDDDAMFEEGGDALIAGNWTEELGEDFFGFKALGLDKELGMSTLSIPSRLFHGRAKRQDAAAAEAASKEPPPPYPPPPPFVPFTNNIIDPPIGLLASFYREKMEKLGVPPPLPTPDPTQPLASPTGASLPDDPPDPLKVKAGPLGQITPPAAAAKAKPVKTPGPGKGNGKKKNAGGEEPGPGPGEPPSGAPPAPSTSTGSGSAAGKRPAKTVKAEPATGLSNDTAANGTSPTKRKSKAGKKKATGGAPPPSEAPQAGPIVMATA